MTRLTRRRLGLAAAGVLVTLVAGRLWPASPLRQRVGLSQAVFDRDRHLLRRSGGQHAFFGRPEEWADDHVRVGGHIRQRS